MESKERKYKELILSIIAQCKNDSKTARTNDDYKHAWECVTIAAAFEEALIKFDGIFNHPQNPGAGTGAAVRGGRRGGGGEE